MVPIRTFSVIEGSVSASWKVLPPTIVSNVPSREEVSTLESATAMRNESVATRRMVLSATVSRTPESTGREESLLVTL